MEVAVVDELSRWVIAQNIARFQIMLADERARDRREMIERLLEEYLAKLTLAECKDLPSETSPPIPPKRDH